MGMQLQISPCRAFGPFELDASTGELRKGGVRLRLAAQPFRILLILLGHSAEVVTREQLRNEIWGDGTFVDFEHSLSAAINKLRRALGDSADNPRYIETVPGRGYRFIGSVLQYALPQTTAPVSVELPPSPAGAVQSAAFPAKSSPGRSWLATGAAIGAVFVAALLIWIGLKPGSPGAASPAAYD